MTVALYPCRFARCLLLRFAGDSPNVVDIIVEERCRRGVPTSHRQLHGLPRRQIETAARGDAGVGPERLDGSSGRRPLPRRDPCRRFGGSPRHQPTRELGRTHQRNLILDEGLCLDLRAGWPLFAGLLAGVLFAVAVSGAAGADRPVGDSILKPLNLRGYSPGTMPSPFSGRTLDARHVSLTELRGKERIRPSYRSSNLPRSSSSSTSRPRRRLV